MTSLSHLLSSPQPHIPPFLGLYLGAVAGAVRQDLDAYSEVLLNLEEQVRPAPLASPLQAVVALMQLPCGSTHLFARA